jgi:hypothetical protein
MRSAANADDVTNAWLRVWARGIYRLEAATELLIRTGCARSRHPWVLREPSGGTDPDSIWIDFASIPEHIGAMSGGERRLLMFAASLSDVPDAPKVALGDVVSVDEFWLELMLAALAHAGGGQRTAWGDLLAQG